MGMINRNSRRFTRSTQYSLPQQGRYRDGRARRRIELVRPESGGIGRNPADRRS